MPAVVDEAIEPRWPSPKNLSELVSLCPLSKLSVSVTMLKKRDEGFRALEQCAHIPSGQCLYRKLARADVR